jgi:hypothetical protein
VERLRQAVRGDDRDSAERIGKTIPSDISLM